jgi:hypothetical protein
MSAPHTGRGAKQIDERMPIAKTDDFTFANRAPIALNPNDSSDRRRKIGNADGHANRFGNRAGQRRSHRRVQVFERGFHAVSFSVIKQAIR